MATFDVKYACTHRSYLPIYPYSSVCKTGGETETADSITNYCCITTVCVCVCVNNYCIFSPVCVCSICTVPACSAAAKNASTVLTLTLLLFHHHLCSPPLCLLVFISIFLPNCRCVRVREYKPPACSLLPSLVCICIKQT